mmetsp:Transcript_4735/g.5458  ORF Transcript_4735/g.5458 Transcript_4735/m.5458 type:complete len:248 (+) Transcript_4735:84-827(+)
MPVATPSVFEWRQCVELGYADGPDSNDDMAPPVCFNCGKSEGKTKLLRCSKCQVARYCSRECQVANWKKGPGGGHKFSCDAYKRVGEDMMVVMPDEKESARKDIFQRIRFYACPYFVYRSQVTNKRGFLFLQSDSTLAEMSLPVPILANGRPMTKIRGILMHFLTMEEYNNELCKDDFEMFTVKNELQSAVENYKESEELAVMMRFRCGHMAVGITQLMPNYALCETLGKEYYEHAGTAVQLNIDDV